MRARISKKKIYNKIEELAINMEKSGIREYIMYLGNTKKVLYTNFVAGIARGVGYALGFTILLAIVLYFFQWIVRLNLPIISEYIADLIRLIQYNKKSG